MLRKPILLFLYSVCLLGLFYLKSIPSNALTTFQTPEIILYQSAGNENRKPNGELTYIGSLMELCKKFLEDRKISYEVRTVPWPRALREASTRDNALLSNMFWLPEREKNYHWVYLLNPNEEANIYIFAKNNTGKSNLTKQQIIKDDYSVVCANASAQCTLLEEFGFAKDNITTIGDSDLYNQEELLLRDRADFMVGYKPLVEAHLEKMGLAQDALIPIHPLEKQNLYLAAPKTINPALLKRLRTDTPKD